MVTQRDLDREARQLARLLDELDETIVFAESCTTGLIAATLGRIPGISGRLCGSAVVYQVETKHRWLGVPRDILDKPGPVSRPVAEAMAQGVLRKTPHATIAASVTGHLGPDAPKRLDGVIHMAVASIRATTRRQPRVDWKRVLVGQTQRAVGRTALRVRRQREAAAEVIRLTRDVLERTR